MSEFKTYLNAALDAWRADPQGQVDKLRADYQQKLSNVSPHCDEPDNCGVNCPFDGDICLYRHLANRLSELDSTPAIQLAGQRIAELENQLSQIQDQDDGSYY